MKTMMKLSRSLRSLRSRRAAMLAVSVLLTALAAMGMVLMTKTMHEHQNMNHRKRELNRAYHNAEAGIDLVIHWGNNSLDYTDDTTLFTYTDPTETVGTTNGGVIFASGNLEDQFTLLQAALEEGPLELTAATLAGITTSSDTLNIGDFISSYGAEMGEIKKIRLMLPDDEAAPALPVGSTLEPEMVIQSVGRSERELDYTLTAWVDLNPFIAVQLPAALVSFGLGATFGNAQIHWGESWSKDDFSLQNKSQYDYLDMTDANFDPWAVYRTEGQLTFPNSWQWDNSSPWGADKLFMESTTGVSSLDQPGLAPDGTTGNYQDAFYQNVPSGTLPWPDFASFYQEFKDFAISHGRYYTTNADDEILNSDGEVVDFMEEFQADADGDGTVTTEEREAFPYDIAFIDTIDGLPPADDGSNLATITLSGGGPGLKGLYYICANFDAGGVGNPPNLTSAEKPDLTAVSDLEKIFLDGVMYTSGTCEMGGNAGVYGSVVAEMGFVGGGTPNIYYNHKLADGLVLEQGNLGSRFDVVLATSQAGDATELVEEEEEVAP